MPGPPRKRDEERRRRNKDGIETIKINLDEVLAGEVDIPAPPMRDDYCKDDCDEECEKHTGDLVPDWHMVAHQLYMSAASSGQSLFYEPSDWALLYAACEALSRELKPKPIVIQDGEGSSHIEWVRQPVNGAVMGQVLKAASMLMLAEGSRRTLRIELDRKKAQDAKLSGDGVVTSITQNRGELFKS